MKTKQLIIVAVILLTAKTNAQIKIHTGGRTVIGSLSSPLTNPTLQVVGNSIFMSTMGSPTSAPLIIGNNSWSSAGSPDFTWYGDANTGIFHPNNEILSFSTNGTERLQLYSNGYGYIGTTPRTSALWTDGQLTIGNPTANDHNLVAKHTANTDWQSSIVTELNRTNSTTYNVYNTQTSATTFYVTGAGWVYNAGGIYNGSDKNIKDDIKNIDSASSKISKLNGVTYKLKTEKQNPTAYPTPQEYMGVIAQDVEKVIPGAVKTVHDGTKAVCYDMIIGLLVEAFKEQGAKLAQMESDLNNCCTKSNERLITPPQNGEGDNGSINTGSYIKQNSPNPFNKETAIEFFIAEKGATSSVLVFDMNGKLLKTLKLEGTGKGSITISANDFRPGMYYYSLIINNKEVDTKKMILTE